MFPNGIGEAWGSPSNSVNHRGGYIKELGCQINAGLGGFIFIVAPDGKFLYVSEGTSPLLGLSQVDLPGNPIYDYISPSDHEEMAAILRGPSHLSFLPEIPTSFVIRMKCILAKRSAGIVSNGFKVIHCSGYLKIRPVITLNGGGPPYPQVIGLVAFGHSLPPHSTVGFAQTSPPNSLTEIHLHCNMFMFRASAELRLTFTDACVTKLTGYEPQDLIERTLYHFVHPLDADDIIKAHITLKLKEQVTTKYYRFLSKDGGWVWMQSYMIVVHNTRSSRPYSIVSINYVLSEVESKDLVLNVLPPKKEDNSCDTSSMPSKNRITHMKSHSRSPPLSVKYYNKTEDDYSDSSAGSGYYNDYSNSHMVPTPNILPHQPVTPISMQNYQMSDEYVCSELIFPYNTEYSAVARPFSASSTSTSASSSNESCSSINAFDNQHMLHGAFTTNVMQPLQQPPHPALPLPQQQPQQLSPLHPQQLSPHHPQQPQPQQQPQPPQQPLPDHQHHQFAPAYQPNHFASHDPIEQQMTGYASVIVDAQQCAHGYCDTVQHKLHHYEYQDVERKL